MIASARARAERRCRCFMRSGFILVPEIVDSSLQSGDASSYSVDAHTEQLGCLAQISVHGRARAEPRSRPAPDMPQVERIRAAIRHAQANVGCRNAGGIGHDHCALDDVLELADVAGPRITSIARRRRQRIIVPPPLLDGKLADSRARAAASPCLARNAESQRRFPRADSRDPRGTCPARSVSSGSGVSRR